MGHRVTSRLRNLAHRTMRFDQLRPASSQASKTLARVKSSTTACEEALASFFEKRRFRFIRNATWLIGKPDLLFERSRVAVFCDGDFWHGKNWTPRRKKLARGHNAEYWIAKIRGNILRDRQLRRELEAAGWTVLRFWESDILAGPESVGAQILRVVRRSRRQRTH